MGEKIVALNRKVTHDYFIEQRFEAGLILKGWEVKALREGRAQLVDSYVIFKRGEAFLLGAHIPPLPSVSTHITPDPSRTRKLLLHKDEISKLIGSVERKGYSVVATKLYFKQGLAKVEIALAKGKKTHDKRETIKKRESDREQRRALKSVAKQ